ncbi:Chromosome partition protein Smc [Nymphon striatum]|nr:Chromosome partition protein Smc [Nymphon striatum]
MLARCAPNDAYFPMVDFNKLRLLGFKSFVEPTEFAIEGGLTGVVGPNGCGKSNLVEALRWVMGESSYKNMRASGMDDVIFSGSGTRPSRNTAEVALFLDNDDRTAPAAFNDTELLQVTHARAKDVQLLFADQSTGARSPSMVGQGRIGELIQAKPTARRALLEEAAGISGLHSRRHEAELRLRGAETNLERLDDVTSELESQIESLKRQARQANRFRTLSRDVRQAEATLLHLKWVQAKNAEGESQSKLSKSTTEVAERAQIQMEAAKLQGIAQKALPPLRDAEMVAAAVLQRLTIARDQLDSEAGRLRARKAEYEQRIAQLSEDIAREERMVAENADILTRLAQEETTLKSQEEGASDREAALALKVEEAKKASEVSEADLATLTAERAEALALRTQLQRRISETSDRRNRLEGQKQNVESELASLNEKIGALADPAEKQTVVEIAEAAIIDAEKVVTTAEENVVEARSKETNLRPDLSAAREALNTLEAEARTIAKLINAGGGELFPAVIEQLKVDKGFETALGAALGDDLDVPTDNGAPVYFSGAKVLTTDPKLPEGAAPLGRTMCVVLMRLIVVWRRLVLYKVSAKMLCQAIAELRSAISSLNKEGRERLLVAFEEVQTHFKKLFTHLFNGGTAELQLVESDDPLEAGLEIVARPPGKKPQTMTLLSGGEQALTAMALIFAVFLTNPAPICVLDEVDAPLDDHNVERFCDLMDQMSKETDTRFVIITHNPITMARMDRLFGVTMKEQGVSQLVSVDLQQAEELREAS